MRLYTKRTAELSRLFKEYGYPRHARAVLWRDVMTAAMVPIGAVMGYFIATALGPF